MERRSIRIIAICNLTFALIIWSSVFISSTAFMGLIALHANPIYYTKQEILSFWLVFIFTLFGCIFLCYVVYNMFAPDLKQFISDTWDEKDVKERVAFTLFFNVIGLVFFFSVVMLFIIAKV